jgi:hypothetical protein
MALLYAPWAKAGEAERVEVISLGFRSAEEMIPLIAPLVGPNGAVTGLRNQLVVRTTPERLAQIRELIAQIDRAPRRLLITVRTRRVGSGADRGGAVSGEIGNGARVTARVWSDEATREGEDEQRLQVLEGNPAFILSGVLVPYRVRTVMRDASGRSIWQDSTAWQEVDSGVEVVPRLSGDRVVLDIRPRRRRLEGDGRVAVEAAATTVSGRLGEWIELFGLSHGGEVEAGGIGHFRTASEAAESRIRVRVDLLP